MVPGERASGVKLTPCASRPRKLDELNWPFKPDIVEVTDTGGMGVVAVAEHADIAASFQVSA